MKNRATDTQVSSSFANKAHTMAKSAATQPEENTVHTAPANVNQKHIFPRMVEYDSVFCSLAETVRLVLLPIFCETECVL
jgi:hypothetical protein